MDVEREAAPRRGEGRENGGHACGQGTGQNARFYCRVLLVVLNMLVPVLCAGIPLWAQGKGFSDCKPAWSDEFWWWQQAEAVADHGAPLGYFGYNGGTAAVGTFAAWGMMPVMPYGLFAKFCGWPVHGYVYANLFYQMAGILLFILLAKPGNGTLLLLLLVNAGQVVRNDYLIVAMQESVRCSIGLVSAGLLVWLYRHRDESGRRINFLYGAAGVWLSATAQIYLLWAVFFPPYFWLLNKRLAKRSPGWVRACLTAGETAVAAWLSKYLLELTCTPYFPKCVFFERLQVNLHDYAAFFIPGNFEPFFVVYHGGTIALLAAISVWMVAGRKKLPREEMVLCLSCCALPVVFLAGHIALYNTLLWSFTRGMAMALFVFSFGVCAMEATFPKAAVAFWCALCLLAFAAGTDGINFAKDPARCKTDAWARQVEETRNLMAELEECLDPPTTNDPWAYTVGTYMIPGPVTFAMPSGYADNAMLDNMPCDKMEWIMIGKETDPGKAEELKNGFLSLGYAVSAESDTLLVLRKAGVMKRNLAG